MAKSHDKDKIAGLDQETYDHFASEYSKGAIFAWLAAGIIYSIVIGEVFSLPTLLLIFPGVFVISIASIPFFLLKTKRFESAGATRAQFVITRILDVTFPIVAAIIFVRIAHGL